MAVHLQQFGDGPAADVGAGGGGGQLAQGLEELLHVVGPVVLAELFGGPAVQPADLKAVFQVEVIEAQRRQEGDFFRPGPEGRENNGHAGQLGQKGRNIGWGRFAALDGQGKQKTHPAGRGGLKEGAEQVLGTGLA